MSTEPTPPTLRTRIVTCPGCGGDSVYSVDNPSRPFCSARCKNADFGAWATESCRLAARPSESDAAGGEPADPDFPQRAGS